jgi:hypothetical protein
LLFRHSKYFFFYELFFAVFLLVGGVSVCLNKLYRFVSATISELMLFQFNILNVREVIFKCLQKCISRNLTFVEFVYILLTGGRFLWTFVYIRVWLLPGSALLY